MENAVSADLENIERQAMGLPIRQRAMLAEHLLASLDEADFAENERMWLEEADRRYREYKAGRIAARPYEAAMDAARERLQ